MSTANMTDKERRAMKPLERARSQGIKLSDYTQAHGACDL